MSELWHDFWTPETEGGERHFCDGLTGLHDSETGEPFEVEIGMEGENGFWAIFFPSEGTWVKIRYCPMCGEDLLEKWLWEASDED